jgi:geranylgeranyl diphosphate synthase type II
MNKAHIQQLIEAVNNEINKTDYNPHPPELYDPIRYFMGLGGKRLRPLLCLLSYQLFNSDWARFTKPATALEIFHNFTLLHDDIMDNAPLRRGMPTVHEKWNKNVAILSGDVMLVIAYEQFDSLEATLYKNVIAAFNQTAKAVCEGQQMDMNFEELAAVSIDEYMEMIRRKTAVLLGLSCRLGGMFAGVKIEVHEQLERFGTLAGVAFQLKDDILDVFGDPEKVGKQPGGDIIQNKKTWLLIKALELAEGQTKTDLNYWLGLKNFDAKEKVNAVRAIYQKLNIEELAENTASNYIEQAYSALESIAPPSEAKENLKAFTNMLLNRAS